jgi:hypothetical protein
MGLSRIENPIEYLNEGEDGFENNIQVLEDDGRNEFDNEQDIEAGQMELSFDSSDAVRFACSSYKSNCAVRHSIKNHHRLSYICAVLSRFAAVRKISAIKSRIFFLNNFKLRTESLTRWSSTI